MNREDKRKKLLKEIQIGATALVTAAGVTMGVGCSKANTESKKQNIPYTECLENLEQLSEEANERILLDYLLFHNDENFSKLNTQGKANAKVQVDKDIDEWFRIQIAKAVTEGTHQECRPEDVWTFCSFYNPGFTWEGANNTYTVNEGRTHVEKTLSHSSICDILELMARGKQRNYLENTDGRLIITEVRDGINGEELDEKIKRRYSLVLHYIKDFMKKGKKVSFNGENFSVEEEKDLSDDYNQFKQQQLNMSTEDLEGIIKSLNVKYREDEQTLEQLDRQLKEYADLFETGAVYTAMSIKQKNELYRKAERDMCKFVRIQLADAITKGTGTQCLPEDVVIFTTSDRNLCGITWQGAEQAITFKRDSEENPQDQVIKDTIESLCRFNLSTRYDNEDGMTITDWINENTDTYEKEKKYGHGRSNIINRIREMKSNEITYNGEEFNSSKLKDKQEKSNDSMDMTH